MMEEEEAYLVEARRTFYKLPSKDEQDLYLQGLLELKPIQRRRPRVDRGADRNVKDNMIEYHAMVNLKRIKICKLGFCKLFNIGKKRVERIGSLLVTNVTPRDLRGKAPPGVTISAEICALVHNHIASFPVHESHYTTRVKHYLSANLNIKIMHTLFVKAIPELKDFVKYHFYWDYFHKNFNLTFGRPAQDTCSQCEQLKNKLKYPLLNDNDKRVAAAQLMIHVRRSKKFYNALKASGLASKNEDGRVLGLCFDFMAVFDLPKVPIQDAYYFRQLSLNNFGIYNLKDDSMTCYVYHEGTARKSPDDVISFLIHYLQNFAPSAEELHLFCDNCGGQNKNHALLRAVMALVELKMFKTIKVFFPIRGHSYLPCDRAFGLLKRKLKKIERLYTPNEYIDAITTASHIQGKIKVMDVNNTMIQDFQGWYKDYYYKIVSSIESRNLPTKEQEKFMVSKYHYFEVTSHAPRVLKASTYIDGIVLNHFPLRKMNVKQIALPTARLYQGKNPINAAKMDDLKKLKSYLTKEAQISFWNSIYEWPTVKK